MTRRKKIQAYVHSDDNSECRRSLWSEGPGVEWDDPTFEAVASADDPESPEIDLSVLTEKQRFVIECSFGLGRGELSTREIAALMGISHVAVYKLKEKALTKLRRGLTNPL